jgi:hypothetical protein
MNKTCVIVSVKAKKNGNVVVEVDERFALALVQELHRARSSGNTLTNMGTYERTVALLHEIAEAIENS